jgi:organic hydroperoxide reductase OsmC/OhrA
MISTTVELRTVEGTQAAMGWAGEHTIVVDRPEGKAGGLGLGFNGAQLLALAIGGCFCNDLRYVAEEIGVELGKIAVTVTVTLEGKPLLATSASMMASCEALVGSDPRKIIDKAKAITAVSNSLRQGVPVAIEMADADGRA